MPVRHLLIAAILLLALPVAATADLPPVPKHAKRVTKTLAYNATWAKAMHEISNNPRWERGARPEVTGCKVTSRRRGGCDYMLASSVIDPDTGYPKPAIEVHCQRHVTVTLKGLSRRVTTHVTRHGCEQVDISRP